MSARNSSGVFSAVAGSTVTSGSVGWEADSSAGASYCLSSPGATVKLCAIPRSQIASRSTCAPLSHSPHWFVTISSVGTQ